MAKKGPSPSDAYDIVNEGEEHPKEEVDGKSAYDGLCVGLALINDSECNNGDCRGDQDCIEERNEAAGRIAFEDVNGYGCYDGDRGQRKRRPPVQSQAGGEVAREAA